jgi:23S rRNA (guanosine2251-2'-O)-methyltransferase
MKRLIAGPHQVIEALRAKPGAFEVVYLADGVRSSSARRVATVAQRARVSCETLPRAALDEMADKLNHQGVVAVTGTYPYLDLAGLLDAVSGNEETLLVVLDQIQDPGNLGAIIRSAHALGADGLILTRNRSAAVTGGTVRSSAGATELTRIARVTNLARCLDELSEAGLKVYGAASEASEAIDTLDWNGPAALVLGNESRGLRRLTREHCDGLFSIPLARDFDSLNVSAAAAIALYAASVSRSEP